MELNLIIKIALISILSVSTIIGAVIGAIKGVRHSSKNFIISILFALILWADKVWGASLEAISLPLYITTLCALPLICIIIINLIFRKKKDTTLKPLKIKGINKKETRKLKKEQRLLAKSEKPLIKLTPISRVIGAILGAIFGFITCFVIISLANDYKGTVGLKNEIVETIENEYGSSIFKEIEDILKI